jgi:hypothetical protein
MICRRTAGAAIRLNNDQGREARLLRAYAMQVEVLRRLRNGGHQFVRVEHVHVNDGGQAVIGNVQQQDTQVEERRTT